MTGENVISVDCSQRTVSSWVVFEQIDRFFRDR